MTVRSSPASEHDSAPGRRTLRWTRGRKLLFGAIGFGSIAIAAAGFIGSYSAVRELAEEKGFGWFAPVFPLAVDLGIAVLLALDLALQWMDLPFPPLRYIAWLLTTGTVLFNAASSDDLLGAVMHAVIPMLFIAVTEATRHAVAKAMAMETNQRMDSIRPSRWLLAPAPTFAIWRAMRLWEIKSYSLALEQYQAKMLLRQELRGRYGWRWRRKAPGQQLRPLRQARLGVAIQRGTAHDAVAVADRRPQKPEPTPASPPAALAGLAEGQSTDAQPAQRRQKLREGGPVSRRTPKSDSDTEDAETAVPAVNLGVGPEATTKAKRAERIYLAHLRAGVPLAKADLAKQAGYRKEGSGRTQYILLEKRHGPIVERETPDQLDLTSQPEPDRQGARKRPLEASRS